MEELARLRNKLLHEGEIKLAELNATQYAMAVLGSIEWLFEAPES